MLLPIRVHETLGVWGRRSLDKDVPTDTPAGCHSLLKLFCLVHDVGVSIVEVHLKRRPMRSGKSKRVFRRTASRSHKFNNPNLAGKLAMRGGRRL